MTAPLPSVLSAADRLAETLADPRTVWPDGRPAGGRAWPQSLAGGASGIALLHIERARTGHGSWKTAHTWLTTALRGEVSAAVNASLFFGAPALAFITHCAANTSSAYGRVLERLDEATLLVTRHRLAQAHRRIDRAARPPMQEFDLIQGLSGLAAYHLSRHPAHEITREVLTYLVHLTEATTERAGGLPPWWMDVAPTGAPGADYPDGHGNFGLAHGIGSALSILSLALLRDVAVAGMTDAVARICAWTDQWRQGDEAAPWWPGLLSMEQATGKEVHRSLRPRPSWCYGIAGTARAQQLAGLALRDPVRVQAAENALLAVLRDPAQLNKLSGIGLCHGTAGLLHAAWRIATESGNTAIAAELPRLADRLITALSPDHRDPELLDGAAGVALALHTLSTGSTPAPHWDTSLALA